MDVERGSGPEVLDSMAMDDLMGVLKTMPEDQYTVLNLHLIEGFNHEEIGEMLKLNESQVKVYLFRARQKMKDQIKDINNLI